jgi:hypothetical protein
LPPQLGDLDPEVLDHHLGTDRTKLELRRLGFDPHRLTLSQDQRGAQGLDGFFRGFGGWRRVHGKYRIRTRIRCHAKSQGYPQLFSAIHSSGTLWSKCMARAPPVNAVKHIGQLRC